MQIGGESYEVQRRALSQMKLTDSSNSLEVRVKLTKQLAASEKKWRDRLLTLLTKGNWSFKQGGFVWKIKDIG